MSKDQIKHFVETHATQEGLSETGMPGLHLFRASAPIPCAPAVYEPCVVAILSGAKEAVLEGKRYVYDSSHYMCCPHSMPVQAGTPNASAQDPLLGVFISLDQRVMTELTIEMDNAGDVFSTAKRLPAAQGIKLAQWDADFSDALWRLVQLQGRKTDAAILGNARLRELYYAILNGEAGDFARQAFAAGNAIARSIAHVSSNLEAPISIDDMATRAGMSRAVFHRKFKQATAMSPIQFVKSMRLGNAAMKIASGMSVNAAALDVGYVSPSQFSREFKRVYGQSPRQWSDGHQFPLGVA